jgi:N-methylhydantoinase B
LGGHDGLAGAFIRNPGTDREELLFSKVTQEVCRAGEVLEIRLPSGGGFGDPYARDARAVLDDVLDEYLTAEDARRDYGVVVDTETWTVDKTATRELRSAGNAA